MSYYSIEELRDLGVSLPKNPLNIKISKKTSLYNQHLMQFNDNIRIDDFCVLSGKIKLGSFIHIGTFCAFYGGKEAGIFVDDFCTISPKATIFATNDDFSGEFLISPMVEKIFCNIKEAKVILQKHTQICAHSLVLPGVVCAIGSVLGAMSLLKNSTNSFGIYAGIPARRIAERSKNLLNLERKFLASFDLNASAGGGGIIK